MPDIEEDLDRTVTRALMTGIALTKPAWESVPVDPCEPTGEMKNVVSTDVTPLRDHIATALSPLLNRVRAEALREFRIGFGRRFALQDPYGHFDQTTMSAMHRQMEGLLDAEIDRIEQNREEREGNET